MALRFLSLMVGLSSIIATSAAAGMPSAEAVLAWNARAVLGNDAAPRGTLRVTYAYSGGGLLGREEDVVDLARGWFIQSEQYGPVRRGAGFDGRTPWMRDISQAVTPELGGDRRPLAVSQAYRNANLWWRPDRGGAVISYVGLEAPGHHLRVAPLNGKPFDAWFSPGSGLLTRIQEVRGFTPVTTSYAAFKRRAGLSLPGRITVSSGQDDQSVETLTLEAATRRPAKPVSFYARKPAAPHDWILPTSGRVTTPMRLLNNHIFVEAMVNGKGPFPFIMDTGGHDILTPSTALALGLKGQGEVATGGAGAKTVSGGYLQVSSISVGGLRLKDQTVFNLEFSALPVEGLQTGGMLGFEVFRRFVVRIDYGAMTVTFIDPARFGAGERANAGVKAPFDFYDHMPQVRGRFERLPARYNIDTGARNEITLTEPFVARAKLRDRFPQGILATDGWGVGGPTHAFLIRAPTVELGSVAIAAPVTSLSTQTRGAFSDESYEGNIGSGLLKRFVVTFDYGHGALYLKRLDPPPADAGAFDRLGGWINLTDQGFLLTDVASSGAGARAGLRAGDIITSIDGRGRNQLSLSDARQRFRQAGSAPVDLVVLRDGSTLRLSVVLTDQLPSAPTEAAEAR